MPATKGFGKTRFPVAIEQPVVGRNQKSQSTPLLFQAYKSLFQQLMHIASPTIIRMCTDTIYIGSRNRLSIIINGIRKQLHGADDLPVFLQRPGILILINLTEETVDKVFAVFEAAPPKLDDLIFPLHRPYSDLIFLITAAFGSNIAGL